MGFLLRRIPPSFDFAQDGVLSFCRRTPTGEWKLRALARRASFKGTINEDHRPGRGILHKKRAPEKYMTGKW
jgi:hypothetical protein